MNTRFSSGNIENLEAEKEIQKEAVSYEHAGYQVRVHFNGDKTLSQCIQNLAERKMTDPEMGEPEKAEHGKGLRVQADGRAD